MNQRGFTLVETLVSLALTSLLLVSVGMAMRMMHSYTIEEGVVSSSGDSYPLAPAASQSPSAMNIMAFAGAESGSSLWTMATDRPLDMANPSSSDRIPALLTAPSTIYATPTSFRTFLAAPGVGLSFSAHNGYAVLYFNDSDRCSAVLNVEFWDDGDSRFYRISFHPSITSSALAAYSFCEPLAYVQTSPSLSKVGLNELRLTLPDPGVRYALNAGRLERSISDPVELATAVANLDPDGGLLLVVPLHP